MHILTMSFIFTLKISHSAMPQARFSAWICSSCLMAGKVSTESFLLENARRPTLPRLLLGTTGVAGMYLGFSLA